MQQVPTSIERVVRKYRSDVNQLSQPASDDALDALEAHLQRRLPPGLRAFLAHHNGADLLRGSLRIRSTADIAFACDEAPGVVLFADSPDTRWAFAPDSAGVVYGSWDGGRLAPLHGSFGGWLKGTLSVIESPVRDARELEAVRYEADPNDVHQLIHQARRALEAGEPEQAEATLRRVTVNDPSRVLGWQYLGDSLAINDRTAARQAWLAAFRRTRFPLPWPGAASLAPEVVRSLERAFSDPETWELELERFLEERVEDVRSERGAQVVTSAARALAASRIRRGQRSKAREGLSAFVARCHGFALQPRPWDALIELARLEIELGYHDEGEALLRRMMPVESHRGKALLLLAELAINRQEPWAEDILREARRVVTDEVDRASWGLLATERALRLEQLPVAEKHLEEAGALARRVALPVLDARLQLLTGDHVRSTGDWKQAEKHWLEAERLLVGRDHAELENRVQLRLGDAAAAANDLREAEGRYLRAAEGFGSHELLVREAWALLRLAHVRLVLDQDDGGLLRRALTAFEEADLAVGVAAHDAIAGDPASHLDWHLARAQSHARARYDAQRARPPRIRADADRPERRLGAHRMAIATCSDGVVEPLARRMDVAARAIGAAKVNPKDEAVLHYIGAADLLSGHRSWAASEVLLRHLMEQKVDGHAWRALQGAIARSPNAALVHGLLEQIELPRGKAGRALAAAAELLGIRREPHAVQPLIALSGLPHSPIVRKAAIVALGRIGDRAGIDACLEALETPGLEEVAALSLLLLGDRRGLDFHAVAMNERRTDLSGIPGELIGRYGGPEHFLLLTSCSDDEGPAGLGALQGLGLLGDSRAVPTLLQALARRDRKVVDVALGALELLTGHHEDDEPGFRGRWHAWWEKHAADFQPGVRYREGQVFGGGVLIERLKHDDPWVRRTAYDELCITTGQRLPFDAEGPWRMQRAHIRAWGAWWNENGYRFQPGGWYLDGRKIG